jgi:hypothetical protein
MKLAPINTQEWRESWHPYSYKATGRRFLQDCVVIEVKVQYMLYRSGL